MVIFILFGTIQTNLYIFYSKIFFFPCWPLLNSLDETKIGFINFYVLHIFLSLFFELLTVNQHLLAFISAGL